MFYRPWLSDGLNRYELSEQPLNMHCHQCPQPYLGKCTWGAGHRRQGKSPRPVHVLSVTLVWISNVALFWHNKTQEKHTFTKKSWNLPSIDTQKYSLCKHKLENCSPMHCIHIYFYLPLWFMDCGNKNFDTPS